MKIAAILGTLASSLLLLGCASYSIEDRVAAAEQIATLNNFSRLTIPTSAFDLTAFVGPQKRRGVLRVYIEGDGFAWVTRHQPSRNPTPIHPVALKLAVLDRGDVAYLARPCQQVAIYQRECNEHYWTSKRFAPEVVAAMDEAITRLKQNTEAEKLVLIGYSGGGAIAALVAARRTDVVHLITVAGNLDPRAWARLHSIPELRGSLNPSDYWQALAGVRQTHFVGATDDIVPIDVYRSYRKAFPEHANIRVKVVPQIGHGCCWENAWPNLLSELD